MSNTINNYGIETCRNHIFDAKSIMSGNRDAMERKKTLLLRQEMMASPDYDIIQQNVRESNAMLLEFQAQLEANDKE